MAGMASEERWHAEREFFDHEEYVEGPIPANTIERYMMCRKRFLGAEYGFWILGDLRGKRVLEVGCGDGANAVLLAMKGADVVGIDISPRAIEIARKRAELHGVADSVRFYALPLEAYLEQTRDRFDIVCGFAVLHHLLPVLERVLADMKKLGHEQTSFLFAEPVSLSRWLRRIRLALPLKVHGTPDERPLEPEDLAVMRRNLPNMQVRLFGFLLRVWGRMVGGRYEDYPPVKKAVCDVLGRLDWVLLSLPGFRRLASGAIMYSGQSGKAPSSEPGQRV